MKTALIVLGIVFLVLILIVGVVATVSWVHGAAGTGQDKFFTAVAGGDPQNVMALMDPALREQVDPPVLEEWMKCVNANLGKYNGLSKTDFNTETKIENSVKITESKGTVLFEKGQAKSELKFRNDLLVAFNVDSDKFPPDWFKGPASTDLYQRQGREFIELALGDKSDKAFEMEHPSLQEAMPLKRFQSEMAKITKAVGKVKSVKYLSDSTTGKSSKISLDITFQVECEKKSFPAKIRFQFVGLQGHLVAFDLTGKPE